MMIAQPFRLAFMLIILSFVIFFHELGHFASCKLFGIRTPVFSIGFGPPIVQKKIGQTTFQISMLPFGGYVSMNARDINKASYWQKMIITLSGIFNNFLLSWFLLCLIFFLHRKKTFTIFEHLIPYRQPEKDSMLVLKQATTTFLIMIKRSFYFVTMLFRPKPREQREPHPVTRLLQQNLHDRFTALLVFVAAISIELGVFNVLPIPMLDGGQAMNYTLEAVANTLLPEHSPILIHFIYLMLFIGLLLYLNRRAGKN